MKKFLLILAVFLFPSCKGIPVAVSYTGAAAGHQFQAGYSTTGGAALVVSQK